MVIIIKIITTTAIIIITTVNTIYGGLHARSCVDRLYIPKSNGGSGLVIVEDCVEEKKCNLSKYATQSNEALVKTAAVELNLEKHIAHVSKKEKKEN